MPTPDQHWARLKGRLTGLTDQTVEHQLAAWAAQQAQLAGLRRLRADRFDRQAGQSAQDLEARALMGRRIADLDLKISGQLADCIAEVVGELNAHGITWQPTYYLGSSGLQDGEFWTTDRACSINIPWYLADDRVWRLVNDVRVRYSREDVLRTLRHETAHALGYAFELWKRADWTAQFGDFTLPYRDAYEPDPDSRDFVQYLHRTGPSQNSHYAQKHPDEDWAETFATWIDPAEQPVQRYRDWPGALAKVLFVDRLVNQAGALYGDPPNQDPGQREPYTKQRGTVGQFVGQDDAVDLWSPSGQAIRQEVQLANDDLLADLHWGSLGRTVKPIDLPPVFHDPAWQASFRQVAAAADGWACCFWNEGGAECLAVPAGGWPGYAGSPLIVLDCRDRAWWPDFPGRKDLYLAACWRNLNWEAILERWNGSGAR